jgi:serine/threonine-protein kinase RsbW
MESEIENVRRNETVRHLSLKNEMTELPRLADWIGDSAMEAGFSEETIFDLTLVMEEIVSNIVRHGYDGFEAGSRQIDVSLAWTDRKICVEVGDDAKPFNPLDKEAPDLNRPFGERPTGGLGIHLVRRLTDELAYRFDRGRNVLELKKWRSANDADRKPQNS